MLHGIIRAATAALLFVVAILVYINYFHHSDSDFTDRSELASAPEVPSVPLLTPEAAAPIPAAPLTSTAPLAPQAAPVAQMPSPRLPRAEILESAVLAEIVELPPSPRQRAAAAHAAAARPPSSTQSSPLAQPAVAKPIGKRTHVVQPGESLWVISKKYLGSGELNGKIADCNGLTSRDHIRPGQVLVIPELNGPNAPGVIRASMPIRVCEDLADDEEARHVTRTSMQPENNRPSSMSASGKNNF